MKLYLLTSNTHMDSVEEFPNFEIIGVFDSLEKAQEVKQSYALELTSSILDIPISEKDYLLKQDEYKATADEKCSMIKLLVRFGCDLIVTIATFQR